MDISNKHVSSSIFKEIRDLTANIENARYSLCRYLSTNKEGTPYSVVPRSVSSQFSASLIVLEGSMTICMNEDEKHHLNSEEGVHILGSAHLILTNLTPRVVFLLASDGPVDFMKPESKPKNKRGHLVKFSDYHVEKPWGWEKWYTKNVDDTVTYALKMIYMKQGQQSSLQSHVQKSETNVVISGSAEVLYGLQAPKDRTTTIPIDKLTRKVYSENEGWSNKVQELHRVIAKESYKAIEISTPELDDVVRWADDAKRPDGRISSEHRSGV